MALNSIAYHYYNIKEIEESEFEILIYYKLLNN